MSWMPSNEEESSKSDEPLVLVPIPPLLTVLAARDGIACIALPVSEARALAEARGYDDINPENVWNEWLEFKK